MSAEFKGVVFELDDLLSIVELAKAVEAMPDKLIEADTDRHLPLRVSVGDALREAWVAHIVVDPTDRETYVDFTPEARP